MSLRILKSRRFRSFAKKLLSDSELRKAAKDVQENPTADLGGGVFKQRIARAGGGKSGGYRAIVAVRRGERVIFLYGFPKNNLDNIDDRELRALQKLAKPLLEGAEEYIDQLVKDGELTEVPNGDRDESPANLEKNPALEEEDSEDVSQ